MKIRTSLARVAMGAAVVCALLSAADARRTVQQKKQAARSQFEIAERLREALEGKRESLRTRADYQKVMEAYRKVYHTAPNSIKADVSVLAVAELLDDQGRVLHDAKSYSDAIGQLVFLRREYPGSKYRVEALFTIGEIYRDDLNNNAEAQATFEDYLKHYPNSRLAPQAKQALAEIGEAETGGNPFKKHSAKAKAQPHEVKPKAAWADLTTTKAPEEKTAKAEARDKGRDKDKKDSDDDSRPAKSSSAKTAAETGATADDDSTAAAQPVNDQVVKPDSQPHRLAHLTSIRHWSTPDYTRVAIDVEEEVKYQSGRVPHPDRIFFDLYDTKLAADLVGKSFDVEAGFLHRIRVAQYKANMARVVLDVDDVAEYSAFLLPNPYRLIIDIHGKLPAQQVAAIKTDRQQPSPSKAVTPESDVTVTQIKPAATSTSKPVSASSALEQAPSLGPGAQKTHASASRDASTSQDPKPSAKTQASADKTVQTARVDPPKVLADDPVLSESEPAKVNGKPTTGPTFQAIAPQESSRSRKKLQSSPTQETAGPAPTGHVAAPTAQGERSLIRALGLKIGKIVVDAGHGGHDTGTVGPNGLMEKDLVLDVALKLGKLLEDRLGAEVVYTRDDDTFIPLETRTAIANKEQADLFISIHANSSSDTTARGVETYYLNFTSSHDALEVASRENAVSEKSIHELQDLVKKIALKEKIEESREFAADVNRSLYTGLSSKSPGIHNRGVKKAPFIVLIGANMPSILAEISFVSNPTDERKLKTNDYRQRVAESLFKGINKYVSGLSGVKVASKVEEDASKKGTAAMALK
ncbi:MAG TPA: N-acetylmuramoyl-L-alanine amidase [Candidatus Angelobacter sp.]